MTCPLKTLQKCSTLPSVRLGPNNMLSVFPKCNDNLLSTNQSEQDSKTLPSFFDIKSTHEKKELHYHQHIKSTYSHGQYSKTYH